MKLTLVSRRRQIVAGLAIVCLVSFGAVSWVYAHPPVEEVTERTNVQTVTTDVETTAVVTGNSTLWNEGTRLEGRGFYPAAAPNVTVRALIGVPDDRSVNVSQELLLVYRVTDGDEVVGESVRSLERSTRTVSDGEASIAVTLDTRSIRQRLDAIDAELHDAGNSEARIRYNASYDTGRYNGTSSTAVSLAIGQSGYWIEGSPRTERVHSTPITRGVTRPPETAVLLGLGGVGVAALLGAGFVRLFARRLPDERSLRDRIERRRYEEWISVGRLRGDLADRRVELHSIDGVVDVGIDAGRRTIYDPDRGLYGVIDGDVLYYYPERDRESTMPCSGDEWEWPFDRPEPAADEEAPEWKDESR